jgi:hypothetical protein
VDPEIVNDAKVILHSNVYVALNNDGGAGGQSVDFLNRNSNSALYFSGNSKLECDHGDFSQSAGKVDTLSTLANGPATLSAPQNNVHFSGGSLLVDFGTFKISSDSITIDNGATIKIWVWNAGGWNAAQLSLTCTGALSLGTAVSARLESSITAAPPAGTDFTILTESAGSYAGAFSWGQDNVGSFTYNWTFAWDGTNHAESIS